MLLLSGDIGSGKTSLSAWLLGEPAADDSKLHDRRPPWHAGVFCSSRLEGASLNPRDVAQSVSAQLVSALPEFAAALVPESRVATRGVAHVTGGNAGIAIGVNIERLTLITAGNVEAFQQAVQLPLTTYLNGFPDRRVHLLFDGLDEHLLGEPAPIIELVTSLHSAPRNLRLLVTVRNDSHAKRKLQDAFLDVRYVDLDGPDFRYASLADVQRFVEVRANAARIDGRPWRPGSRRTVRRLAGSSFLFASILAARLDEDPDLELGELPQSLAATFERECARIEAQATQGWDSGISSILRALVVAQEPLPEEILARAAQLDLHDLRYRMELLSPFITRNGGKVAFRHAASAEYFRSEAARERGVGPEVGCHRAHAAAYRQQFDGGGLADFDRYAFIYWPFHTIRATPSGTFELAQLVAAYTHPSARAAIRRLDLHGSLRARPFGSLASGLVDASEHELFSDYVMGAAAFGDPLVAAALTESLARYCREFPRHGHRLVRKLLTSSSDSGRRMALMSVTYLPPAEARALFLWIATKAPQQTRQEAPLALYVSWAAQPADQINAILRQLARDIRLRRPIRTKRLFDFMAQVTITNYINHCDDLSLMPVVSDLWYDMMRPLRLLTTSRAQKIFLRPTLAKQLAARVTNAVLFEEAQDWLDIRLDLLAIDGGIAPLLPLFDLQSGLASVEAQLEALLDSRSVIAKVLAGQLIAANAFGREVETLAWLEKWLPGTSSRINLWVLLSFTVLLGDTPPSWMHITERLTAEVVRHQGLSQEDQTFLERYELLFLPYALARAKSGQSLDLVIDAIRDGGWFGQRALGSIGLLGMYYPDAALQAIHELGQGGRELADLRPALATMYPVQRDVVDVYLHWCHAEHLIEEIQIVAGAQPSRQLLDLLGHYNNGINESVRHPFMRDYLLKPVYESLLAAEHEGDLLVRYLKASLKAFQMVDYRMIGWTT